MPECNCGSGLEKRPLHDAYGIFCTYVCDKCEEEKMSRYDPRIFGGAYEADEPIEPEE
jgi:hypothetical protein